MMGGWGFNMPRAGAPSRFDEQYHCFSVAYADKSHLEGGDKILLPPSAFDTLARLNVSYPMLFQLQSPQKGTMTHSGVLEFTAEEGSCFIPFWMMQNLLIEEGSVISVTNITLPKATFVKLQPQHVDFLEITNPRAVLEHALRSFSCVTKGDVICIPYNNKNYHFEMKEVQPNDAACIIETDCNVDFDAPVGYVEPDYKNGANASSTCSSPTPSSASGVTSSSVTALSNKLDENKIDEEDAKPKGLQIIDGQIVRPDDQDHVDEQTTKMLAPKTGATGIQKNSAIPIKAPTVDYWAVQVGDGARLDGKKVADLKDKGGNLVDVGKLRAEAAARRAKDEENKGSFPKEEADRSASQVVSKRKSRIGNKYSKRKQDGGFAFDGQGQKM